MAKSKRNDKAEAAIQQLRDAYRQCFGAPAGQIVLADLKAWGGVNPFDPDTTKMAFNCGKLGMVEMIENFLAEEK